MTAKKDILKSLQILKDAFKKTFTLKFINFIFMFYSVLLLLTFLSLGFSGGIFGIFFLSPFILFGFTTLYITYGVWRGNERAIVWAPWLGGFLLVLDLIAILKGWRSIIIGSAEMMIPILYVYLSILYHNERKFKDSSK